MQQEEIVNHKQKTYQSFTYLLGAVLTYSIGSFFFGYCLSYFNSFSFKKIHEMFNINMPIQTAQGIFSGCLPFGALFGAYFSSHIIHKFTRKQSFIVVDVLAMVATLLTLITYPYTLLIGRFLQGFCVGVFSSLVPLMVKELSPQQLSGSFGAIMIPSIGCGFFSSYLFSYILSHYLQPEYFWAIVFGFPILIMDLQIFLVYKIYSNQTPKYLISKGKITEAKLLIYKIYKREHAQKIFMQKVKDLQMEHNWDISDGQDQNDIEIQMKEEKKQQKETKRLTNNSQVKQYPPDIKLAKVFAFILQTFHQLSGINVVVIFGHHLAEIVAPQLKAQMPLIINGEKILAGLCGTLLLRRFGRRYLMLRGLTVIFISLISLSIGFALDQPQNRLTQIFIMLSMITFVSAFVMTQGPITWLYIAQIVQPPIVPLTTMLNWCLACLVITLFPILKHYSHVIFLVFGIATGINLVMCYLFMVQTKDKKQVQIREQFKIKQQWVISVWNNMSGKSKIAQSHVNQ